MKIAGYALSALAFGAELAVLGPRAKADDPSACQAVLEAIIKQTTVPVHQKITIESAAAPGKPIQSETIHAGDTLYIKVRGQWMARPYDARKAAEDARQAMPKADHSCTRVGNEALDGHSATLYSVQSKTATGSTDSRIWISPSTGLPLRQHTVMLEQGATMMQHEVGFDYANVRVPAGGAH